jgi:hypothetical protein
MHRIVRRRDFSEKVLLVSIFVLLIIAIVQHLKIFSH